MKQFSPMVSRAAVAGLAITLAAPSFADYTLRCGSVLGALAANKDHVDDTKYRDDNYYGPRHTSYVPGWMVGTFRGYNPQYGADIEMRITSDGRTTAETRGQTLRGWINDHQLHVGRSVFSIDQTRVGFVTAQKGDRFNEVRYRRVN